MQVGDLVFHLKYGEGVIMNKSDNASYTVDFGTLGIKEVDDSSICRLMFFGKRNFESLECMIEASLKYRNQK